MRRAPRAGHGSLAAFSACGSDPAASQAAAADGRAAPQQEGPDAERVAELVRRSRGSDRHLELKAEEVAERARELQSQGSDRHLELQAAQVESEAATTESPE